MEKKRVEGFKTLGTIVSLKNNSKRLMITGRMVQTRSDGKQYDYLGCLYPEGHVGGNLYFMFNENDIGRVHFEGLQGDPEELVFLKLLEEAADA